ncbi:MFS transporter [Novosphingobium sp. KA1]|uniref:MFS transporter n=1 Tax=Novosphingobium sp. (strain KA1) TaxID=164608 RepID=UPI001A8FFA9E|nr:MFS transporter [Novosphingobium sp. KA1]QSR20292.1 MFS transporter [Novosphingobium sp. KA1]
MLSAILPVRSLLAAIFLLMAGGGFLNTLVALRLERSGSGALTIGLVGTAYFAGLTLGSIRVPALVGRIGHIRAFATFVALLSADTLAYALYTHALFWGALRLVDGLCLAGIYVCIESWLNERASPERRGVVLAGYMILLYGGQAAGQFLIRLGAGNPAMPLLIGSILVSVAAIPVLLTRIAAPDTGALAPLPFAELYKASPLGMVGAGLTGMMLGAFYALGAVFARRLGMDLADTTLFMSAVILGGVILQWPLGWLSDRIDRRKVIVLVLAGTLAAALTIVLAAAPGSLLLGLGALFGGLSFALYPLCVAHTNDHLSADRRVAASGGLVLVYSLGAAAGPAIGSLAVALAGASGLFLFIAACASAALSFALMRQARSEPVPAHLQEDFVILPRTSPLAASLDPLALDPATGSAEQTKTGSTH